MQHFNILESVGLPQTKKRDRGDLISEEDKKIAEKLDFSFYDGGRSKGYGGYYYDGRWKKVAKIMKERYKLARDSKVLIDRCHKGFLVYDLMKLIPGITVYGIHPGNYAIAHSMEGFGRFAVMNNIETGDPILIEEKTRQEVTPYLIKGESDDLLFKDNFFDCIISIENACSYPPERCMKVIREIIRVSKNKGKYCYIQNDSWKNEEQKEKLMNWSLLCKTHLSIEEWEKLLKNEGYEGDYGFTIID